MLSVFVDADSFPVPARQLVINMACKRAFRVCFVANRPIPVPKTDYVQCIQVASGKDKADCYICAHVTPCDIVLTRDILLAERLVQQGIAVINHLGDVFTPETIAERRSLRDCSLTLHNLGCIPAVGKSTYNAKNLSHLANSLDRLVTNRFKLCKKK